MSFGTFKHQGQSRIRERWGQTNEIIAELTNYHPFHPLTACNINGVMALVRFIVVFVWEAFALWSHLLQHISHPLECIMEMKFLLLLCMHGFFIFYLTTCFFFLLTGLFKWESRWGKKRKYVGLDSRLDQAGICEEVPIRDRPFRGKLDPSTF